VAKGRFRVEETKTAVGRRTIALPEIAIATLERRRGLPFLGQQSVIIQSTRGALRDPDTFAGRWRQTRGELGVLEASSHSFRKSLATPIDDPGSSARIGVDHLGHATASMSQGRYMTRGRVHTKGGRADRQRTRPPLPRRS